ncbi:pyridoxal-phosphate dependent enzyme [Egicoccus sp. AB-alg6-2]|uniref:pyridoxal-phosphate dependent enzyme n=1 Tax=Egicoccus sp. AB-alg6-2 TaxID=3242692 RepID=UPI00359EA1F6
MTTSATGADRLPVDFDDVERAAGRLAGVAHRTPVLRSSTLDAACQAQVFLKSEHLQRVGAFKFRGAYNALAALDPQVRSRGVVAFSSGNHAQAVALAARLLGVHATIVMPLDAPPVKMAATRGYGAEVVTYDRYTEDRRAIGQSIADERGATVIPPYDHPDVIAGQATAALELLDEVPDLDAVIAPVGGGGLLAGTAVAVRTRRPSATIVGVEPAGRRAARDALARGEVVQVAVPRTLLDGQQTPEIGTRNLALFQAHVDRVEGVEDADALAAVRLLATRLKQVVEPSGASALGALLAGGLPDLRGARVGVLLSGGNVAPAVLAAALNAAD